jgi:hypothetical protein
MVTLRLNCMLAHTECCGSHAVKANYRPIDTEPPRLLTRKMVKNRLMKY